MKNRQDLSISDAEQAASAQERRLCALQAHEGVLSERSRCVLAGLIEGSALEDIASRLALSIEKVTQEIKGLCAQGLAAPQLPRVRAGAAGDSFEAIPNERLATRRARYFPVSHVVPDAQRWGMLRLEESIRLGEVEIWLLANIGPGNTGAIDLREPEDVWHLGRRTGYWCVWFKYQKDYRHFVATWLTPQITSQSIQ